MVGILGDPALDGAAGELSRGDDETEECEEECRPVVVEAVGETVVTGNADPHEV